MGNAFRQVDLRSLSTDAFASSGRFCQAGTTPFRSGITSP
jgi:hypothetical protein